MSADDPVKWLAGQIQAAINLREKGRSLRTREEASIWWDCELRLKKQVLDGIAARSPRDVARVETVDKIIPLDLPEGHPWAEPPVLGMAVSTTGEPVRRQSVELSRRAHRAYEGNRARMARPIAQAA